MAVPSTLPSLLAKTWSRLFERRVLEVGLAALGLLTFLGWLLKLRILSSFTPEGQVTSLESSLALLFTSAALLGDRKNRLALTQLCAVLLLCLTTFGAVSLLSEILEFEFPNFPSPWDAHLSLAAVLGYASLGACLLSRTLNDATSWTRLTSGALLLSLSLASLFTSWVGLPTSYGLRMFDALAYPEILAFAWLALLRLGVQAPKSKDGIGRVTALFASALAVIGAVALLMAATQTQSEVAGARFKVHMDARKDIDLLRVAIARLESSLRSFLLSGEAKDLLLVDKSTEVAKGSLGRLEEHARRESYIRKSLEEIQLLFGRIQQLNQTILRLRNTQGPLATSSLFTTENKPALDLLDSFIRTLVVEQDRLVGEWEERTRSIEAKSRRVQALGAGFGFILVIASFLYLLRARNRIEKMREGLDQQIADQTAALRSANEELGRSNEQLLLTESSAREAEAFIRMILANSPLDIWAVDTTGRYTLKEGRALLGTTSAETPAHPNPKPDNPLLAQYTQQALKGEAFTVELAIEGRWYSTRYAPIKNEKGDVLGAVGLATDITARKEVETRATQEEGARQAARLHSEFLANMGHEIRTPMNGIVGMTGLLNQTALTEDQRGMIEVIQNSAEALLTAVTNIVDLSRMEAGKLQLEAEDLNLRAVVEDLLSAQGLRAHEKGIELINDYEASVPADFKGDEMRLRQLLSILLSNGINFTKRGHVLLRVRKTGESDTTMGLRIEMIDTGCGIPPERQAGLLAPFKPGDGKSTRGIGSSGLGLAIAKQLVDLMKGRMGFSSAVGSGSMFWIELDLPKAPSKASLDQGNIPQGTRVLVLDDNEITRGILVLHISALGATVDIASEASRAVDLCVAKAQEGTPYAVLFVDRFMPGIDGLQFLRLLRSKPSVANTPVVLMTPDPGEPLDPSKTPVNSLLVKPLHEALLRKTLMEVLQTGKATTKNGNASKPGIPVLPTLKLLVVDDNLINQRVCSRIVTNLGHKTELAGDGAQALSLLEKGDFDGVLMDCQMPVLDGFEATQRLRASQAPWSKIKIIAVTANSTPADRQRCKEVGMDDFVAKPINADNIGAALARCFASEH